MILPLIIFSPISITSVVSIIASNIFVMIAKGDFSSSIILLIFINHVKIKFLQVLLYVCMNSFVYHYHYLLND